MSTNIHKYGVLARFRTSSTMTTRQIQHWCPPDFSLKTATDYSLPILFLRAMKQVATTSYSIKNIAATAVVKSLHYVSCDNITRLGVEMQFDEIIPSIHIPMSYVNIHYTRFIDFNSPTDDVEAATNFDTMAEKEEWFDHKESIIENFK